MESKPSYKLSAPAASFRPTLIGRNYAVSCGHYLAALIATRILDKGGNAVDAGVAAAMALAVLQPDIVSFAGVAPTLVYSAGDKSVTSLAGLGYWPAATSVDRLISEGGASIPEGLLRTVLPAAPATHVEALRRFGSISFAEAAAPAAELACNGFAAYPMLANSFAADASSYARWPSSAAVYLPNGRAVRPGELFRQEDLGRTIGAMIAASERASGGRHAQLRAASDWFYKGPVAQAIAAYHATHGGFLSAADLAGFEVPVEKSLTARYADYVIHTNDAWCQGLTLLQALSVLNHAGVAGLAHNSPQYLHLIAEALNLAFADREAYLGDPKFVSVPVEGLLSDAYSKAQLARIRADRAFGRMPEPGRPDGSAGLDLAHMRQWTHAKEGGQTGRQAQGGAGGDASLPLLPTVGAGGDASLPLLPTVAHDTIYCSVIDKAGNLYSATLSDNTHDTPVIPGTGLTISSRGSQSRLFAGHPSEVKPLKRPRLTPAPAIITRNGEPFMALGTPGGDVQMQAMLQVFLNVVDFGMPLQRAIECPRVWSANFPNSFAPHDYVPGRLCVEDDIEAAVFAALRSLGHKVEQWARYPAAGGAVCAVMRDPHTGLFHAGADPRRECYAMAW